MRIRLHGAEDEVHRTADQLAQHLDVIDASRLCPYRPPSRLVRLHLIANPPTAPTNQRSCNR